MYANFFKAARKVGQFSLETTSIFAAAGGLAGLGGGVVASTFKSKEYYRESKSVTEVGRLADVGIKGLSDVAIYTGKGAFYSVFYAGFPITFPAALLFEKAYKSTFKPKAPANPEVSEAPKFSMS